LLTVEREVTDLSRDPAREMTVCRHSLHAPLMPPDVQLFTRGRRREIYYGWERRNVSIPDEGGRDPD